MTLICAMIAADTQAAAKAMTAEALAAGAEAFEVRLDHSPKSRMISPSCRPKEW